MAKPKTKTLPKVWASQAVARDLEAERDALRAELAAAREEIARITALYEERGELAEHHKAAFHAEKARADKAEAEVVRLTEKERMVDAAISVLSISNTEKTLAENLLPRENAYWTAAQDDVARAIRREMWERDRADKAEQRVRELEDMIAAAADFDPKQASYDSTITTRTSAAMRACEVVLAEGRAILAAREQKEGGR